MAHSQEFDDVSHINAIPSEEVFYDSDEESDDMESYNAELAKKEALKLKLEAFNLEREDAYKKRISDQLANSGEALAGKLNWCNVTPVIQVKKPAPAPTVVIPEKKQQKKVSKRFGKAVPMDIDIRVCGSSLLMMAQPESEIHERSAPLCKYVISGTQCPFGQRCKFSHHTQQHTQQRKLQKFRMCRNIENCRWQNDCIYAHSEAELRENVLTCHAGVNCRKIRIQNDEYVNTVFDRKCMYIHPNEKIRNFIRRTAN